MRFLIVISHFPAARFQISARGFFRQAFPKCSPTAHIQSVFHLEGFFYVCLRQSFPPIFLVVLPALYFYILFFKKAYPPQGTPKFSPGELFQVVFPISFSLQRFLDSLFTIFLPAAHFYIAFLIVLPAPYFYILFFNVENIMSSFKRVEKVETTSNV